MKISMFESSTRISRRTPVLRKHTQFHRNAPRQCRKPSCSWNQPRSGTNSSLVRHFPGRTDTPRYDRNREPCRYRCCIGTRIANQSCLQGKLGMNYSLQVGTGTSLSRCKCCHPMRMSLHWRKILPLEGIACGILQQL